MELRRRQQRQRRQHRPHLGGRRRLHGDNSSNEQGFTIERAPAGSTAFVQVGSVAANVKTFAQTVTKGTWLYRVRAVNTSTGKTSAYSNTATVKAMK